MKTSINILLILILLSSCHSDRSKSVSFYNFDYDYELRSYNSDDLENHKSSQFYLGGKIIRHTDREGGCFRYYYDSVGRITETTWGRNCDDGLRTIYVYDSLKNHIGYYIAEDSNDSFDNQKFVQIYFYNSENRLINERTDEGVDITGVSYEIWKYYTYSGDLINTETIIRNSDTIWIGFYSYNSKKQLKSIHRIKDEFYETERFKYNNNGLKVEEEIRSNKDQITPETSFSSGNNKIIYKFDSEGIIKERKTLNHNGEVFNTTIYRKFKKTLNAP